MLGLGAVAAAAVSASGWFNASGATSVELEAAQRAYFDSVNEGFVWGPKVNTSGGVVGGVSHEKDGVDIFWNIPYAASTAGVRRFAKPEDPEPWSGVRRAYWPPRWCPQMRVGGLFFGEEDCLHLNVYRPRDMKEGEKLPVMVWIYGGSFQLGDSVELGWYNGKHLSATQRVIVVSMNYRLGSLGYLALDALKREQGTAGNWGLLDQQKALEWVQTNIEGFGGDKGRVTIFGESAGGCSVVAHVSMPGSRGLFHAAIAESPVAAGPTAWIPWDRAAAGGLEYARMMNCTDDASLLTCLRGLPLKQALTSVPYMFKQEHVAFWPAVDGTTLPATPLELASRGEIADVPILLGTNKNEGSLFVAMMGGGWPLTKSSLESALSRTFNASQTQQIIQHYPPSTGGAFPFTYTRIGSHIMRDNTFVCPGRRFLRAVNTAGGRKSALYMYHFEYDMKGILHAIAGDYHTSELSFVFDNKWAVHTSPLGTWDEDDQLMAAEMGSYWSSFARHSDTPAPFNSLQCTAKKDGKPTCITFPPYTASGTNTGDDSYLVFDKQLHIEKGLFEAQCDFWDSMGYY
eukprot:Hpha_TRINITY_DN16508_c0_g5::TRINITY_DN16508_c0_g5_i1::g.136117::m.136117